MCSIKNQLNKSCGLIKMARTLHTATMNMQQTLFMTDCHICALIGNELQKNTFNARKLQVLVLLHVH